MMTGANRQLHRQSSQNRQSLFDTTESHSDQNTSILSRKPLDQVIHFALAIETLARTNFQQSLIHPKNTLTFNGKHEKNQKFKYLEDLFHTTLRMQTNLTEDKKTNHFHPHFTGLALKTIENIQRTPTTTLEVILNVFRRKYVKPKSSASAKHRFKRLFFDLRTRHLLILQKKHLVIIHTK